VLPSLKGEGQGSSNELFFLCPPSRREARSSGPGGSVYMSESLKNRLWAQLEQATVSRDLRACLYITLRLVDNLLPEDELPVIR